MTHFPHELAEVFPDHNDAIHEIKQEFERFEIGIMPTVDDFTNRLHRQHFAYKDELSTEI